jgi:hypothetical protein
MVYICSLGFIFFKTLAQASFPSKSEFPHSFRGMAITSAQLRASRALLNWSLKQLSAKSGVSVPTISNYEAGKRKLIPANNAIIERVLIEAGITFINSPEGEGAILQRSNK